MASSTYHKAVDSYLSTELGRSTPDDIAARLRQLRPEQFGLRPEPTAHVLHALRGFLESVARE